MIKHWRRVATWMVMGLLMAGLSGCGQSLQSKNQAEFRQAAGVAEQFLEINREPLSREDYQQLQLLWFAPEKVSSPVSQSYWPQIHERIRKFHKALGPVEDYRLMYLHLEDEEVDYFPIAHHGPIVELVYVVYGEKRLARINFYLRYDNSQQRYVIDRFIVKQLPKGQFYEGYRAVRNFFEQPVQPPSVEEDNNG